MAMTLRVHQLGITCAFIGIPKYPFYALAACGWTVLFLAMACLLIKNIKERVHA
jgi:hypothetical protein